MKGGCRLCFCAAAALATACRDPTEVKVDISTDMRCQDVHETTITLGENSQLDHKPPTVKTTACSAGGALNHIGSIVVVPSSSADDEFSLMVVAGIDHPAEQCQSPKYEGCIVARRALHFVPHTELYLPITLRGQCQGVPCDSQTTCVLGQCVSSQLPHPELCGTARICDETGLNNVAGVALAACTPRIDVDGVLEPTWSGSFIPIGKEVLGSSGGVTGEFQTRWNQDYLYVGARVHDAKLENDSDSVWDDDSVEVYLDMDHNKSTDYDSDDFQFIVGWNDDVLFERHQHTDGGVLFKTSETKDGYEMELALPWSALGVTPHPGTTYGFDVGLNIDQDGGSRDGQRMWHGNSTNWTDTSAFGEVTLLPCPGRPQ